MSEQQDQEIGYSGKPIIIPQPTAFEPGYYGKGALCGGCLHHKKAHEPHNGHFMYCGACGKLCGLEDFNDKHTSNYQENGKQSAAAISGAGPSISNAGTQAPFELTGR